MKALLQIAALIALGIDAAQAVMLYWTIQSPGQDGAGRGMASGFLMMIIVAMMAAALLLAGSYWRGSGWAAATSLIVALAPLVPIVLPALL